MSLSSTVLILVRREKLLCIIVPTCFPERIFILILLVVNFVISTSHNSDYAEDKPRQFSFVTGNRIKKTINYLVNLDINLLE